MSHFVELFENETPPAREPFEAPQDRKARLRMEKHIEHEPELDVLKSAYKPDALVGVNSDPYKTLFVGRLAYETTERTLRRVFEEWGRVIDVKLIHDRDGRSRGYAFIEFESERDLKDAYKYGDGIKIDGRHVLVDVERGRTVPGWLPRRLGGGRGPGRVGYDPRKQKKPVKRDIQKSRGPGESYRNQYDRKRGRSPDQRPSYNKRGGEFRSHHDSRYSSRKSSYDY
jgi:U1 small nuclear ribonucleoprotein